MQLLFLAPEPFFQERGTPIAVRLALEVLAKRQLAQGRSDDIDLLTYHEGSEISIPGVKIQRIKPPTWLASWLVNIGPGVSVKKLVCDLLFLIEALRLCKLKRYDLIHSVEESVFIALLIKLIWGTPYIYDMDSSVAQQLTEKWFLLRPLAPIFSWFERIAIRGSMAVVPVCNALQVIAKRQGARSSYILHDISLLSTEGSHSKEVRLNEEAQVNGKVVLYTGNLEAYQGIDLLLESWVLVCKEIQDAYLVIIGGTEAHIDHYRERAKGLGIIDRVRLLGPRPVSQLGHYLSEADILVSPRVRGNNTPMKIYSYLHSGKPLVATNLSTHTQVLDNTVASLAAPNTQDFATALLKLLSDQQLREKLAVAALKLAEQHYTFPAFERQLNLIYEQVERSVVQYGTN